MRSESVGSYVVVPPGVWHTARVAAPTRMLLDATGEDADRGEAHLQAPEPLVCALPWVVVMAMPTTIRRLTI